MHTLKCVKQLKLVPGLRQFCYVSSSSEGRKRLQEKGDFLCLKQRPQSNIFAIFGYRFIETDKTHLLWYLCFSSALYHWPSKLHSPVWGSASLWLWHFFSLKGIMIWHGPPFHTYFLYVIAIGSKPPCRCFRNSNLSINVQTLYIICCSGL